MTIWVCSKCSHSFAIVKTKSGKFPLKVKNLERENTEEKRSHLHLVVSSRVQIVTVQEGGELQCWCCYLSL